MALTPPDVVGFSELYDDDQDTKINVSGVNEDDILLVVFSTGDGGYKRKSVDIGGKQPYNPPTDDNTYTSFSEVLKISDDGNNSYDLPPYGSVGSLYHLTEIFVTPHAWVTLDENGTGHKYSTIGLIVFGCVVSTVPNVVTIKHPKIDNNKDWSDKNERDKLPRVAVVLRFTGLEAESIEYLYNIGNSPSISDSPSVMVSSGPLPVGYNSSNAGRDPSNFPPSSPFYDSLLGYVNPVDAVSLLIYKISYPKSGVSLSVPYTSDYNNYVDLGFFGTDTNKYLEVESGDGGSTTTPIDTTLWIGCGYDQGTNIPPDPADVFHYDHAFEISLSGTSCKWVRYIGIGVGMRVNRPNMPPHFTSRTTSANRIAPVTNYGITTILEKNKLVSIHNTDSTKLGLTWSSSDPLGGFISSESEEVIASTFGCAFPQFVKLSQTKRGSSSGQNLLIYEEGSEIKYMLCKGHYGEAGSVQPEIRTLLRGACNPGAVFIPTLGRLAIGYRIYPKGFNISFFDFSPKKETFSHVVTLPFGYATFPGGIGVRSEGRVECPALNFENGYIYFNNLWDGDWDGSPSPDAEFIIDYGKYINLGYHFEIGGSGSNASYVSNPFEKVNYGTSIDSPTTDVISSRSLVIAAKAASYVDGVYNPITKISFFRRGNVSSENMSLNVVDDSDALCSPVGLDYDDVSGRIYISYIGLDGGSFIPKFVYSDDQGTTWQGPLP